jgi:iron complex transport system permease protein
MTEGIKQKPVPRFGRSKVSQGSQLILLMLLLVLIIIASAGMGYIKIPFSDVIRIVLAKILGNTGILADMDRLLPVVVLEVRLPRILTAAIVGGGLAIAGVVFQGIL